MALPQATVNEAFGLGSRAAEGRNGLNRFPLNLNAELEPPMDADVHGYSGSYGNL